MKEIEIQNFRIGKKCQPFIIAEAGLNHNGDLDRAFEMICVAKQTGIIIKPLMTKGIECNKISDF